MAARKDLEQHISEAQRDASLAAGPDLFHRSWSAPIGRAVPTIYQDQSQTARLARGHRRGRWR